MRERSESLLRILCIAMGALLLFLVVRRVLQTDPLGRLTIPQLPTLAAAEEPNKPTNSAAGPSKTATNATSPKSTSTNLNSNVSAAKDATNNAVVKSEANPTNSSSNQTNMAAVKDSAGHGTNLATTSDKGSTATNTVAVKDAGREDSNLLAKTTAEIAAPTSARAGTNASTVAGTNAAAKGENRPSSPEVASSGPMGGPGKKAPDLPLPIQAQVVRITESEILGQVIRPQPMALLGIAGDVAFLRSPSGQTGVVKEGDELGGLKLLRIGTNRVLVEQGGQKQELMIFSGLGGESLLPKQP